MKTLTFGGGSSLPATEQQGTDCKSNACEPARSPATAGHSLVRGGSGATGPTPSALGHLQPRLARHRLATRTTPLGTPRLIVSTFRRGESADEELIIEV